MCPRLVDHDQVPDLDIHAFRPGHDDIATDHAPLMVIPDPVWYENARALPLAGDKVILVQRLDYDDII